MHDLHEQNRASWNAATKQHNTHKGDQAAFLRNGGSTLFPEEIELLGDVRGKSLVHLQCNAGQDTLSIAQQLGASVTGIDISDEAITFAEQLASDSGIPGTFVRADVYEWFNTNTQQFDVAFASYGAICWLSDLDAWGHGIAAALEPGGHFVLMDFHPVLSLLDGVLSGNWSKAKDYLGGKHLAYKYGVGDYVALSQGGLTLDGDPVPAGPDWINSNPAYQFGWGLADVVSALLQAGLVLKTLHEYAYSNGFMPYPDHMVEIDGRRMTFGEGMPKIPLMYGLRAEKSTDQAARILT